MGSRLAPGLPRIAARQNRQRGSRSAAARRVWRGRGCLASRTTGGPTPVEAAWAVQAELTAHVADTWMEPDEGIWEVRGPRQHFTHSKVMAWVAIDRAIKAVEKHELPADVAHWRSVRQRIHDDVCARGFSAERKSFVQAYGSSQLDASLLMLPLVGFLPARDPRVQGTVEAIGRELMIDGL